MTSWSVVNWIALAAIAFGLGYTLARVWSS